MLDYCSTYLNGQVSNYLVRCVRTQTLRGDIGLRDLAAPSVKSPRELQTGTQVTRIGPAITRLRRQPTMLRPLRKGHTFCSRFSAALGHIPFRAVVAITCVHHRQDANRLVNIYYI